MGSFDDWLGVPSASTILWRAPGKLYRWGLNSSAAGARRHRATARLPAQPSAIRWSRSVAAETAVVPRSGGALFCWGDNLEGKLGSAMAKRRGRTAPTQLPGACRGDPPPRAMCARSAIRCPVLLAATPISSSASAAPTRFSPHAHARRFRLAGDRGASTIAAACVRRQSVPLGRQRVLRACDHGQAVVGNSGGRPTTITSAAGWFHSCGQKRDGQVLLGPGGSKASSAGRRNTPSADAGGNARALATDHAREFFTCGIDSEDGLYCWGENKGGQLGLGDTMRRFAPAAVP